MPAEFAVSRQARNHPLVLVSVVFILAFAAQRDLNVWEFTALRRENDWAIDDNVCLCDGDLTIAFCLKNSHLLPECLESCCLDPVPSWRELSFRRCSTPPLQKLESRLFGFDS